MEIKILGTKSPRCYKEHNCVGHLIKHGDNNIILDFGNGSSRLLEPSDLNNLTIIISHLHKDHYGELLSIGYDSYINHNLGYINKKIKVYIPIADMIEYEEHYTDSDGWSCRGLAKKEIMDYQYLMNFGDEKYLEFITYDETTKLKIDDINISFAKNPHQINTFSTKLESSEGTLVYSGDTGYNGNSLINFAKNSDLLICESTFFKGQTRTGNNHLYAHEAATIAKLAKVKELLLTHFYSTLDNELYLNEAKEIFSNTSVAQEGKILKLERRIEND